MIDPSGAPGFAHLRALTDDWGIFEHAQFDAPRREHGYCVDDVARALIVLMREPSVDPDLARPVQTYLRFLERSITRTGRAHNRMSTRGRFTDRPGAGDWWGRAIWALGVTVSHAPDAATRRRALTAFRRAAAIRSADMRAMAFAALGAAEVLSVEPADPSARALARDGAAAIPNASDDHWTWPEPRLRYANAVLPEALLAAGLALHEPDLIARGVRMLRFLLVVETTAGHLSVTGIDGRGPSDRAAQFDQQPIEVATIADACARAFDVTGGDRWRDAVARAWAWFIGDNDTSTVMFDPGTGAGFDGLTPGGRNENRGAESTLALLSTYQQARRLGVLHTVSA